jgi:chemotaxis protein CheC
VIQNPPSPLHLDALREVANIGCGHAATALSQLVGGRRVDISVPRVVVTRVADLAELIGGAEAAVVACSLAMEGDLTGGLLMVLPESDAHRLCMLLLNQPSGEGPLQEDQRSAFGEVANIVASACLSAIGTLTKFRLLPGVPLTSQDSAGGVVDELAKGKGAAAGVVALEAKFTTSVSPSITGQFLVLPDNGSLKKLLDRLGV